MPQTEVLRISVGPLDKKKAAWWGKKSDILWLEPKKERPFPSISHIRTCEFPEEIPEQLKQSRKSSFTFGTFG